MYPDPASSLKERFLRRAGRAEALAQTPGAGREPLAFAAGLYRAQADLAASVQRVPGLTGRPDADLTSCGAEIEQVVSFAAELGPAGLQEQARDLREEASSTVSWPRLIASWDGSPDHDYLCRALLRPYAEALADMGVRPVRDAAGPCPVCAGTPWIAGRRGASDADGAQRFLGCALCASEWVVNRIRCVACGEENPEKLPCFGSERYPAARIEACATCRVYVKSIDLTVDARAIPEVDDLCSLSLDLWAREEGYHRLEPGLAGI